MNTPRSKFFNKKISLSTPTQQYLNHSMEADLSKYQYTYKSDKLDPRKIAKIVARKHRDEEKQSYVDRQKYIKGIEWFCKLFTCCEGASRTIA